MLIDRIIYALILLSINYEFVSLGDDMGVFRMIILPLTLIGFLRLKDVKLQSLSYKYLLIIFWFLTWTLFTSNSLDSLFNNIFNIIGIAFLVFYLLKYFTRYFESSILITAGVILTYFVPHLIYYLFFYNEGARFSGIHIDPNFAGGFMNLSLMSALYLIFVHKFSINEKLTKFLLYITVLVILMLILATGSRGSILASFIIIALMIFLHSSRKLKIFYTLIFLSIPYYLFVVMDKIIWHKDMSRFDLIVWRFSVISEQGNDFSRMALLNSYMSNYTDYIWYGMGLNNFVEEFGLFPHNLFIDILVEGGVVFGLAFILIIIYLFISSIVNQIKTKFNVYFLIALAGFLTFLPLSTYGLKLFWVLIVFLIISNNNFFHESESTPDQHPNS